jgi:ankyrin repeat protein
MQDHPEERQEPATRLSARLQQAIVDGDVATVATLAPIDTRLDEVDPTIGLTPLMLATEHKQYAIVDVLLAAGADVNKATAQGWTALHHAVDAEWDGYLQTGRGAKIEVVERLLDAGANRHVIYRCPSGDQTPGDMAREYGWVEAAERLET